MKIEELIKKRKQQLDLEQPPAELWTKIQSKRKSSGTVAVWRIAATIFIAFSFALLGYTNYLQNKVDKLSALSELSDDYMKIEQDYLSKINSLEEEINLRSKAGNQEIGWLIDELRFLDQVNETFLQDLRSNAPEDEVIKSIIDYYEKKLRILNKIQVEQKRKKRYEKATDNSPIS
ncbi:MAG: hypothetical protein AAF789_04550 [Bacteroidota bacterium]